jgi:hypothetical protein
MKKFRLSLIDLSNLKSAHGSSILGFHKASSHFFQINQISPSQEAMIEQLENEQAAMLLCLHDSMKPPAYSSLRRIGHNFDTMETREDELRLLDPQLSVVANTGDHEVDRVSKQLICGSLALKYQCLNKSRFCSTIWQYLAAMEQRDAMDEHPTNSIATGASIGFSSNSAFNPFQKPPQYRSAYNASDFSSFQHHDVLGNTSGTANAFSNAAMRFRSFVQDREEVADPSNLMEEVPKTLLLQRMSSFSFPDLDLDFPFTMATDPCQNRERVVEDKQIIQKPQAQWLQNSPEETAVASNPQHSSLKHHRRQTSGMSQEEPSFEMQEDTFSLAGAADERYVVQTVHGPALLLTGKSFCSPSSSISQNAQSEPSTPNNRKFQRWSEEEDETLLYAISAEGKNTHNWKRIAKKYFSNSRTGLQCKSRWTKVRRVSALRISTTAMPGDLLR